MVKAINNVNENDNSPTDFYDFFQYAHCAMIIYDLYGNIIDINKKLENLFGYSKKEVKGKKIFTLGTYVKDQEDMIAQRYKKLLKGETPPPVEIKCIKKNGERFCGASEITMIEINNKKYLLGTIHDTTLRKQAEQKLINARSHSEFFRDLLSHDIANILNKLSLSLEFIDLQDEQNKINGQTQEFLSLMKKEVLRGARLIKNIRHLSSKNENVSEKIKLNQILLKALDHTPKHFEESAIEVKTEIPTNPIYVLGGDLFLDAFENILFNGIVHNLNDIRKLWIIVTKIIQDKELHVKIEFQDNGIGISDDRKLLIFKEKLINKNYKNDGMGMGIGLTLVKRIIDMYGGEIWVEDRVPDDPSQGSNFVILLKICET